MCFGISTSASTNTNTSTDTNNNDTKKIIVYPSENHSSQNMRNSFQT